MGACSISKKEIILGGLDCAHCAEVINDKVSKLEEIEYCNLNFINKKLTIEIACDLEIDKDDVVSEVIDIINDTEPGLDIKVLGNENTNNKKVEITLGGLNCAHCSEEIGNKVSKLDNVVQSNLNFISKKLTVEVAKNVDEKLVIEEIIDIINDTEPGLDIKVNFLDTKKENKVEAIEEVEPSNKRDLIKLIIGSIMYIFGIFQTATGFESKFVNILFLIVYLIVGYDVLLKALKNASKGRVFDENFLMSIATVGAVIIGEVPEAVGVMLFYKIGEYLQSIAVGKSRKSITSLMQIRPDSANLKVGSEIKVVSPEEVSIGDIIVVKPGEKIPLDGVVVDGFSMVDTSALTGESVLREIGVGESALSGFINKNALLTIEVTKEFGESTVSKILDLVENASSKKSKTENFISKFAKYYTPFVLISAMVIAFIPPLVVPNAEFLDWFYRGLVFLVVSCPCALVLSIPLSFFSGIGNSSKHGILIKGSNYLEALKNVDTVVFDKTGTLTKGVFKVTKVSPVGISEKELIEYAAYAEVNSNHPIAKSIVNYYKESIDLEKITYFEEIAAHGIKVKYNDLHILAGNDKLMRSENILYFKTDDIGTVVYIAVNGAYRGYIVISDEIKEVASAYNNAKKAMIVFQENVLSVDAATMIGNIALVSNHIGAPRDGIVQIKGKNNSQGLVDMGIDKGIEEMANVKALLCFGEDPCVLGDDILDNLEFVMTVDTHMTDTCKNSNVVLPGSGPMSVEGTYTNTDGRVQFVNKVIDENIEFNNEELARKIASVYEVDLYKVVTKAPLKENVVESLVVVGDNVVVDVHKCCDNLMNVIDNRLPKQAKQSEKVSLAEA